VLPCIPTRIAEMVQRVEGDRPGDTMAKRIRKARLTRAVDGRESREMNPTETPFTVDRLPSKESSLPQAGLTMAMGDNCFKAGGGFS
jgi:hypothetical protein